MPPAPWKNGNVASPAVGDTPRWRRAATTPATACASSSPAVGTGLTGGKGCRLAGIGRTSAGLARATAARRAAHGCPRLCDQYPGPPQVQSCGCLGRQLRQVQSGRLHSHSRVVHPTDRTRAAAPHFGHGGCQRTRGCVARVRCRRSSAASAAMAWRRPRRGALCQPAASGRRVDAGGIRSRRGGLAPRGASLDEARHGVAAGRGPGIEGLRHCGKP